MSYVIVIWDVKASLDGRSLWQGGIKLTAKSFG
jgi:hypothetical protein